MTTLSFEIFDCHGRQNVGDFNFAARQETAATSIQSQNIRPQSTTNSIYKPKIEKPKIENIYAFLCGKMNDLALTKRCQCHEKKSRTQKRETEAGMLWGQGLAAWLLVDISAKRLDPADNLNARPQAAAAEEEVEAVKNLIRSTVATIIRTWP